MSDRGGIKQRLAGRWHALQDRHSGLRHVLSAWQLLQRNHGNEYAAAITYFSFLALFPLLLLAVSVTGFVLSAHPHLQTELFRHVSQNVPGEFGRTLKTSLQDAIDARTGVGVVGLVGVLLTGLGWIANLREAIDAVWGRPLAKRNFLVARLANLVVLAGLGLGVVISLGLTVAGTSLTDQILSGLGLDSLPGFAYLLKVVGIAVAVAGDIVIFWWLLVRLPDVDVDRRVALKGALLASVGFEVLKIVGTYTIAHTSQSTTYGPFAGIIAILIWIQLVARWMLFCCAWIATLNEETRTANSVPILEPAAMTGHRRDGDPAAITPAAVGATLVGAGAVAGAVATALVSAAATRRSGAAGRPSPRSADPRGQ
jgi:membrane protein